jgi:prophage regulatory protein
MECRTMPNVDHRNANDVQDIPAFLRLREVKLLTGLSSSELYRRIAAGTFPRQVSLGGPRCVAWVESEIRGWIAARIAERDSAGRERQAMAHVRVARG